MKTKNIPLLLLLCSSTTQGSTLRLNERPVTGVCLKNEAAVNAFFTRQQQATRQLKNLNPGDIYDVYHDGDKLKARPSVQQIVWQPPTPLVDDSALVRSIGHRVADKAQIAYDIYLNFFEEKSSGFSDTPLFLEKHLNSIREKLASSSSLRVILGNVFSYIYREDRQRNGYRPEHQAIPEIFMEGS